MIPTAGPAKIQWDSWCGIRDASMKYPTSSEAVQALTPYTC